MALSLVTKPDYVSLTRRIYMAEGENLTPISYPLTSTGTPWHDNTKNMNKSI